jgi:hypothetical protein
MKIIAKGYLILLWVLLIVALIIVGGVFGTVRERIQRRRAERILGHAKFYLYQKGRYSNGDAIHLLTDMIFRVKEGR